MMFCNFNPRTREGCDWIRNFFEIGFSDISIHAPVKGATSKAIIIEEEAIYFNPRTREGCDIIDVEGLADTLHISIHAPVKGATFPV